MGWVPVWVVDPERFLGRWRPLQLVAWEGGPGCPEAAEVGMRTGSWQPGPCVGGSGLLGRRWQSWAVQGGGGGSARSSGTDLELTINRASVFLLRQARSRTEGCLFLGWALEGVIYCPPAAQQTGNLRVTHCLSQRPIVQQREDAPQGPVPAAGAHCLLCLEEGSSLKPCRAGECSEPF